MQLLRQRHLQNNKIITTQKNQSCCIKKKKIFLEKCLTNDATPKSFRIKSPIKTQKATRITKEYRKNLLVLAKSNAKQRSRNYNIEVNDLSQELRSVLSDAPFETIERITNISKEKEYVKKRNHLL